MAMVFALGLVGCTRSNSTIASTNQTAAPVLVTNYYHLNHAQGQLPTILLWVGDQELKTEVATSLTEIATGMMFRTNMAENTAMLFVFAQPDTRSFYMKNCVVPLSAAYIDSQGLIDEIIKLEPGVEKPVESRSDDIQYVLEAPRGWFARHGITTGMAINTSQGPLKNLRGRIR